MIKVREVEDNDIILLTKFLPKGFPFTTEDFWKEMFEWWWISNPVYTNQFPKGWILENEGSIVGFIGNIPVKFLIRGEVRIAAAANSWYVEPSFRGIFSLDLFHKFLNQNCSSVFLFKSGDNSFNKILRKHKFDEYILPHAQKEYVYILDKKKVNCIFSSFIFDNKIPQLFLLLEYFKRFSFLVEAYLQQKPEVGADVLLEDAYISSLCISCDDSLSRLWEPYLNTCDATFSRDTNSLNWLYFPPGKKISQRLTIQCHRLHDKMVVGYMVFDLIQILPNLRTMKLIDICVENNDSQVLASITSFAIKIGKQNNSVLLIFHGTNLDTETYFRSTIPMRRTVKNYRYIRFSDCDNMNSNKDNHINVCLPLIYPPQ